MITGVLTVNVVAPENPLIIFSVKPENVRLVATNIGDEACQNDSVSLSCSADASPPVSSYQFFENDVLLGSNTSGMLTTSLSSSGLLIYRCVASNLVGAANSANVSIDVGGTVTCTCESLRPPPTFLLEEWIFSVLNRKRKMENDARTYRFWIVLLVQKSLFSINLCAKSAIPYPFRRSFHWIPLRHSYRRD